MIAVPIYCSIAGSFERYKNNSKNKPRTTKPRYFDNTFEYRKAYREYQKQAEIYNAYISKLKCLFESLLQTGDKIIFTPTEIMYYDWLYKVPENVYTISSVDTLKSKNHSLISFFYVKKYLEKGNFGYLFSTNVVIHLRERKPNNYSRELYITEKEMIYAVKPRDVLYCTKYTGGVFLTYDEYLGLIANKVSKILDEAKEKTGYEITELKYFPEMDYTKFHKNNKK